MTRDHIKSRASLKGEVCLERGESAEYGGRDAPRPDSHGADSEGSEPVSGEGSGFVMVASDATSTGSPVLGLVAADSPASSRSQSSDMATHSGSKARAGVGVANSWKIKSPRTSAT